MTSVVISIAKGGGNLHPEPPQAQAQQCSETVEVRMEMECICTDFEVIIKALHASLLKGRGQNLFVTPAFCKADT